MVRITVQLTEEQMLGLRRRASEQGVSIAELIRRGVDKILATTPLEKDIRKRALSAIGFIHDPDAPDLSTNHDKYLAEALVQ